MHRRASLGAVCAELVIIAIVRAFLHLISTQYHHLRAIKSCSRSHGEEQICPSLAGIRSARLGRRPPMIFLGGPHRAVRRQMSI
jgi:hypothetical protein